MELGSWTDTGLTSDEYGFLLDALRSKRFTAFASAVLMDPRRQAADALQQKGLVQPLIIQGVPSANLFVLSHQGWVAAVYLENECIDAEKTETIGRRSA